MIRALQPRAGHVPWPIAGTEVIDQPAPGVPFRPLHCDWAWRPSPWVTALSVPAVDWVGSGHALSDDVSLHHDASSECRVSYRQVAQPQGPADRALALTAQEFDGSFLSLVIECSPAGWDGLQRDHMLGVWVALAPGAETAPSEGQNNGARAEFYVRLNVRHGPNLLQLVRSAEVEATDGALAEFDLFHAGFDENRVSQIWFDLIFKGAGFAEVVLCDASLTRRPRAAI